MKTQTALESLGIPNSSEHYLVKTEKNSKKLCEFCKQNRNKSKGGWWVYTRYMCKDCKIPLCNGKPCLFYFHRDMLSKISTSFTNVSNQTLINLWNESVTKAQNSGKSRSLASWMYAYPIARPSSHLLSVDQFNQLNLESTHSLQVPVNIYSRQNLSYSCNEDLENGSDSYSDFKVDKGQ